MRMKVMMTSATKAAAAPPDPGTVATYCTEGWATRAPSAVAAIETPTRPPSTCAST